MPQLRDTICQQQAIFAFVMACQQSQQTTKPSEHQNIRSETGADENVQASAHPLLGLRTLAPSLALGHFPGPASPVSRNITTGPCCDFLPCLLIDQEQTKDSNTGGGLELAWLGAVGLPLAVSIRVKFSQWSPAAAPLSPGPSG